MLPVLIDADTARQQRDRHAQKAAHYEDLARQERIRADLWEARAVRADEGDPVVLTPSRRGQLWGDRS
jgi:hypothetical protein